MWIILSEHFYDFIFSSVYFNFCFIWFYFCAIFYFGTNATTSVTPASTTIPTKTKLSCSQFFPPFGSCNLIFTILHFVHLFHYIFFLFLSFHCQTRYPCLTFIFLQSNINIIYFLQHHTVTIVSFKKFSSWWKTMKKKIILCVKTCVLLNLREHFNSLWILEWMGENIF